MNEKTIHELARMNHWSIVFASVMTNDNRHNVTEIAKERADFALTVFDDRFPAPAEPQYTGAR